MNNNDKPHIWHFDDLPFTGDVSAYAGNTIVYGRTGAGKTTLLQAIVGKYRADAVRQGISIAPTLPSDDEAKS
jgi:type IV secretory pathway VirB4 component